MNNLLIDIKELLYLTLVVIMVLFFICINFFSGLFGDSVSESVDNICDKIFEKAVRICDKFFGSVPMPDYQDNIIPLRKKINDIQIDWKKEGF